MKLTYRPEGVEPREWTFRPNKMLSLDAEAIEKATGLTWGAYLESLMSESVLARRALLWVFLRRDQRGLKFDQVQFALDEVELDFEDDEVAEVVSALEAQAATGQLDEDQMQALEGFKDLAAERGIDVSGDEGDDEAPKE